MGLLEWLDAPNPSTGVSFLDDGTTWTRSTYTDLAADIAGTSVRLADRFTVGDRVLLLAPTSRDLLVLWYASVCAGLPPLVLAPPAFESPEQFLERVAIVTRRVCPAGVIACATVADLLGDAVAGVKVHRMEWLTGRGLERVARSSPLAYLQMTSGTTGAGTVLGVSGAALDENLSALHHWLRLSGEDSGCTWLPWYHDLGLVGSFLNATTEQIETRFMTPDQFVRRPRAWIESFGIDGFTITATPTFGLEYSLRRLARELPDTWDFSSWRVLCLGGERVDTKVVLRFCQRAATRGFRTATLASAYGMAEATLGVTASPVDQPPRLLDLDRELAGPTGEHAPVLVELTDDTLDAHLARGTWLMSNGPALRGIAVDSEPIEHLGTSLGVGELIVRTPSVAVRVEGDTILPLVDDTGALHTGDSGLIVGGEVFVFGRIGEGCKVRGRLIQAEDIECRLRADRRVHRFRGCVSMGARLTGEQVVLLVVERRPEPDELAAMLAVASTVAGGQLETIAVRHPRRSIPHTSSGKPQRGSIWASYLAGELEILEPSQAPD